ncbi:fatty acid desaturase family protein [Rugosimonospora africana]|uniref:Delta fatty acid desaturase n=1 Tax=Rugosimonospora africana TaxID=556532 RepID=A0A8J3VVJ1_9ACTN|nr:acyl-CoA desaturase [Rugosimonospora africana]GIH20335.1 delta fatty acid desaturase [Rugosimonospora africana]
MTSTTLTRANSETVTGNRSDPASRDSASRDSAGSDFAALSRRIVAAGLLKRRPRYYVMRFLLTDAAFAGGWALFAWVGDSWAQLLVAALLAVAFTQVAFLGHDAGHRQVSGSRRFSEVLGLLHGNLGVGLSYGWWMDKHTRHHANPNHEERDPDVGAGAIVWTGKQARSRRGLGAFLARRQAYLFFPLLLLEGLNLHVSSVRSLRGLGRHRRVEAVLLAAHLIGYTTAVLLVLSPLRALAFIAVQQGLFGLYMGCAFAPNHKGMPVLTAADRLDFLRRQVLTSRNVRGTAADLLLGGLNYQIEHHLFPSMPRPNLRRAQPLVRDYCVQHGIEYRDATLIQSYRQVLRHLDGVGAPMR